VKKVPEFLVTLTTGLTKLEWNPVGKPRDQIRLRKCGIHLIGALNLFRQGRHLMKTIMLLMMALDGAATSTPDVQLLDFSAGYCGPCQQMVPILQRMERAKFPIRQIDITEDPELTRQFKVDRIPTLVLLVEGREVRRFVGLTSEEELCSAMNKAAAELSEKRAQAAPPRPSGYEYAKIDENPSVEERPAITRTPERRSLGGMFRKLIGKEAADETLDPLMVRGQNPVSGVAPTSDIITNALTSTVRIRVAGKSTEKDEYLQDVGTGTIVYSATGQAIVLTCAHLFLNIAVKEATVEVEVFEDGKFVKYPAKVVGGDHDADLALLRIRTGKIFPAAPLSAKITEFSIGQPMVSFGCNKGEDPTRLDMKLVAIDRYDGPPNLVCTDDPSSGRSGGGLFTANGELVGVCSCANRDEHEGLYAAHGAILGLVNHCDLKEILKTAAATVGEDPALAFQEQMTKPAEPKTASTKPEAGAAIAKSQTLGTVQPTVSAPSGRFSGESPDELIEVPVAAEITPKATPVAVRPAVPGIQNGPELTITIDDKSGAKRVIVIPQASPWMLEMLTGDSSMDKAAITTALRPAGTVQ